MKSKNLPYLISLLQEAITKDEADTSLFLRNKLKTELAACSVKEQREIISDILKVPWVSGSLGFIEFSPINASLGKQEKKYKDFLLQNNDIFKFIVNQESLLKLIKKNNKEFDFQIN